MGTVVWSVSPRATLNCALATSSSSLSLLFVLFWAGASTVDESMCSFSRMKGSIIFDVLERKCIDG